jgi:hypothetical protein
VPDVLIIELGKRRAPRSCQNNAKYARLELCLTDKISVSIRDKNLYVSYVVRDASCWLTSGLGNDVNPSTETHYDTWQ